MDENIPIPRHLPHTKWTVEQADALASDLRKWIANTDEILLERWLVRHGLSYGHFGILARISFRFAEVLSCARVKKDLDLIEGSLKGRYNINTLKFYLLNRSSDWKDSPHVAIATTGDIKLGSFLEQLDGESKPVLESLS